MPGRGNLQPIGAIDRVGDVEHRRQRARNRLAILDRHVPSGRSAMICTVQPSAPDTRTRTSRKPRPSSTGSAMAATRAATPLDDQPRFGGIRRGASVRVRVWFKWLANGHVRNKKERAPGGTHSQNPIRL